MVYLEPKWLRYLMWPWMHLSQVASFFCHRHIDRKFHIAITINTQYRRFLYYETYIEIASLLYYCAQSVFEDISANYGWCVEKQAVLHIGILMLSCNRFPVASMAAAPVASISHWCKSQLDYSTFEYCEFCWRFVLVRLAYWNLATNECHVFSVMQCKVQR